METDYAKYRGKCKEFAEQAVKNEPTLRLVKGWYDCPIWGEQQHWWAVRPDGTIFDPTKDQFPSKGLGFYKEYKGILRCEYCSKEVKEEDANMVEHHVYCSDRCYARDIGF